MTSSLKTMLALLGAGSALAWPLAAQAQSLPYGDVSSGRSASSSSSDSDESADEAEEGGDVSAPRSGRRGKKIKVTPYIEAQQVVFAELKPGNEVLTYSVLAAGVDAGISGRNNHASVSLRYERRVGWGNNTTDSNAISGVARGSFAVVPQTLQFEAGALAARTSVENNGAAVSSGLDFGDSVSQIYSVYAGPTLSTHAGPVGITGSYRLGYTRVESPNSLSVVPGAQPIDVFDDSVTHNAAIRAGTKPGDALPVGLGVGAGYNREDVSNLDQRIEDRWARGDVTVPVTDQLHLVGGVGYEKVEISSRDAVRDALGAPVLDSNGRLVTDKSAPRTIAYDAEGLIWDAGVVWRPSRRTALEAHVGKRYGSTSYYGSFAYAPNARTSINVSVYDAINGFGGQLSNALAALPTEFEAVRNPFNGSLGGCVAAGGAVTSGQSPCLSNALSSVRSAVFRSRGVMATYAVRGSRFSYGLGGGYDRRKFIAAPGTVLAAANGVVDENIWVSAFLNGQIDRNSSFSTNVYGNLYESGDAFTGDITAIGATAAYYRQLTSKITATAAVGIDGVKRENLVDIWSAQAMVGVRYSF